MYKALDKVQYDTLELNKPKDNSKTTKHRLVKPLVDLACTVLNWQANLDKCVPILPVHVIPKLLQIAILRDQLEAVRAIVASWPLEVLRFKDIIQDESKRMFEEDMGILCLCVLEGLKGRTKHCKLKCLDFQGIGLNQTVSRIIIQMWPLLSLCKTQRKVKNLSTIIGKTLGPEKMDVMHELMPKILGERLNHDILKGRKKIVIPKGQRLEVKMDSVSFSTCNMFFFDYMIVNYLRDVTPLFITVTNIYIKSELVEGDTVIDSLLPFMVLKGQDPEMLDGLSMKQLEEGIFYIIAKHVQRFKNLHSLDIQDCNIYLQEGVTRSRTLARNHLSETLSCFNHLHRLDLSFNYLLGCLGEMLECLSRPLEFLSLRGCDLNEKDLMNLSLSKHSPHLRELNMSKLCQFSIYENDRISPIYLMRIMKHFPKLTVLNLAQNHLSDSGVTEFCDTLSTKLPELKALDIAGNYLQFDNQLELMKACAKIGKMQWIRLTCTGNMFNNEANLDNLSTEEMVSRFQNLLAQLGRTDICIDVVRLSFAIFVDLNDIFD